MKKKTVKPASKKLAVLSTTKAGYEKDISKWATKQAELLKNKEYSKLDLDNLIEEIEDLSKREGDKLISHLENLLMHQLKAKYQPKKHTVSWDASIKEAKFKAQKVLEKNPSLKSQLKSILCEAYYVARLKAVRETGLEEVTFPEACPWNLQDIFSDLAKKYC